MKYSKSATVPVKFVKDVRNEISPSLAVSFNNSLSLGIFPGKFEKCLLMPHL